MSLARPPEAPKLRVGVLCDAEGELESWQLRCLEELLALHGTTLCAWVVDLHAPRRRGVPHVATPDTLVRRPFRAPEEPPNIVWGEPGAEAALRSAAPDLLLCLGFDALGPALVDLAPLGTWCFEHDVAARRGESPPGYTELERRHTTQHARLLRLVDAHAGVVLREGVLRAVRSSFAVHVDRVYGEAARWPAELCRAWLAGLPLPESGERRSLAPAPRPGDAALRGLALRLVGRRLRRSLVRRTRREEWGVGLVRQPLAALGAGGPGGEIRCEIDWLSASPPAAFRADPFGLRTPEADFAFFEEWDDSLGRGCIAAAPVGAEGRAGQVARVLEAPHHLSYPCVFEHGGAFYCVPESSGAGEVALFRCVELPDRWERVATLLEETVVDPTPWLHEGRWWLWCADASGDAATRLRLFGSERLEGPWREHPRSPVKSDVRSARPAGLPFVHDGLLYRPAQDCSSGYGGALVILRIDVLGETEYAETPVARLSPDPRGPYPDGLHTLSALGDWTLVDGKRWARRWPLGRL